MSDEESTRQVSVRLRQHLGSDSLYVEEADGRVVGRFDLHTGKRVIMMPARAELFESAVADWLGEQQNLGHPASPAIDRDSGGTETTLSDNYPLLPLADAATKQAAPTSFSCNDDEVRVDLSDNVPGQGLRARAVAEQREQPVLTFLARLLGVHTDERAWRMGGKGEELVARQLKKLGQRWHVLHSIAVGNNGSDTDHLVIGRGGVFVLNSKHHKGAKIWVAGNVFMVNGQRHPYIRNSRHEAVRVSRILSKASGMAVSVRGVIVVVNAGSFTIKEQPGDVYVVKRRRLRRWLEQQPEELEKVSVEAIFEVARRSSTWRVP